MKTEGYVIARNRKTHQFFTSSSAYDRPSWIPVSEATVYPTADMAQRAALKLAKYGAYEARIVSLAEAIDMQLPAASPTAPASGDSMEVDIQPDGEGGTEMVAADQEDPCEVCEHSPCTCENADDADADDVSDLVDDQILDDGEPPMDDEGLPDDLDGELPPDEGSLDDLDGELPVDGEDPFADLENPEDEIPPSRMRESAEEIKFANPSSVRGDLIPALNSTDTVKMPANVKADLQAAITEFNKCAKLADKRDDAKSSFCMTVAAAFEELAEILSQGTVESMKQAQVKMTSWMNPITSHLPTSVQKFIYMGGRKSTLKDLFDDKKQTRKLMAEAAETNKTKYASWQRLCRARAENCTFMGDCEGGAQAVDWTTSNNAEIGNWDPNTMTGTVLDRKTGKVMEAKNHMGDREYQSFASWKVACRKAYPGCAFRGDKDIGAATLNGRDVGEWDGSVGSVYAKTGDAK